MPLRFLLPLLCALALAPSGARALPTECGPEVICLEAARVRWDRGGDTGLAEGEVNLRARDLELKTPMLRFDLGKGLLEASLGADLTAPWGRLQARTLQLSIRGDTLAAVDAHFTHRLGSGRTLRLDAAFVRRIEGGILLARQLEVTACGCREGIPAWSLKAARARIDLDEGAFLLSPVLKIAGVPLLWLPAFYLPLGSRRSGLLLPKLGYSGRSGILVSQPLYLVLGRSWDLTLEGTYRFGQDSLNITDPDKPPVRPGPAGPALGIELRYAPRKGTSGTLRVDYLYDLQRISSTDPAGDAQYRGNRLRLGWRHLSRFGRRPGSAARSGLFANLQLVSDASLISDLGLRLEERQVGYLRSSVRFFASPAGGDTASSLEVGARYLQDLSSTHFDNGDAVVARPLFGTGERGVPGTLQALPELHLLRLPRPLTLGLLGSGSLHAYTWLRPTGLSELDLPEEVSPHLHLNGQARAERSFHLGSVATGGMAAEVHGDFWQSFAGEAPAARAFPLLRANVQTALEVREPKLRHRVRPSLEVVWAPPVLKTGEWSNIDAWNTAVSDDGVAQTVAALSSRFSTRGTRIDLLARQGWDFLAEGLSELDGRLRFQRGPVRLRARAAYAWPQRALSFARLGLSMRGPRQSRLSLSYVRLEPWASAWLRAGLGELFDGGATGKSYLSIREEEVEAAGGTFGRADEVSLSLRGSLFPGLITSYSVRLDLWARKQPQHVVGLTYEAPCKCLSIKGIAVWLPGQSAPEVRLALDLAGLGG